MDKIQIEVLERLSACPKMIADPKMDLVQLERIKQNTIIQWWNEITKNEEEYYMNYLLMEGGEDLKAYIQMAKLKLVVAYMDTNDTPRLEHKFSDAEIKLIKDFDRFKVFDRYTEDELVDYVTRGEEDEKGKEYAEDQFGALKESFDSVIKDLNNKLQRLETEKAELEKSFSEYREQARSNRSLECNSVLWSSWNWENLACCCSCKKHRCKFL